ncbi:MAG: CoB--CoM heterodisulfide reductase iron-sulfur subunit B family protein [bacterium]|nr:CoB--CoM heterodisulfide reductase iron-sulfur subunit B family protein [bacterium]
MAASNVDKYTYYPGCSQTRTSRAYDASVRGVAGKLGVELVELEDWNCCGASNYIAIDARKAFMLSARNLALAEKTGRRDLVTCCSGCYVILAKSKKYIKQNPKLHADIDEALATAGLTFSGDINVRHILDVLVNDVGGERIRAAVTHPLAGLKVAPYYGCQIGRPYGEFDDEEWPHSLDDLVTWTGAEPVNFPLKAKCCGGILMTTQPEVGRTLVGKLLKNAKDAGADCIVTACSLCHVTLESYQKKVSRHLGEDVNIPVLYFTQLLGRALGLTPKELMLKDSLTHAEAVLP